MQKTEAVPKSTHIKLKDVKRLVHEALSEITAKIGESVQNMI